MMEYYTPKMNKLASHPSSSSILWLVVFLSASLLSIHAQSLDSLRSVTLDPSLTDYLNCDILVAAQVSSKLIHPPSWMTLYSD